MTMTPKKIENAVKIVRYAGGQIVGGTKLQKIAYLLELSGLGVGYRFQYQYYGPHSEELASDINAAWAFDFVEHEEHSSAWGGVYSVYKTTQEVALLGSAGEDSTKLASVAAKIDAVELELAVTAAYLKVSGHSDPWEETKRRKPDKATDDRIDAAKESYRQLMQVKTPSPLPEIV